MERLCLRYSHLRIDINPCHYFSRVMSCFFVTTHTFSFIFQPLDVLKSKGGDQKYFPFHHFPLANVTKNTAID